MNTSRFMEIANRLGERIKGRTTCLITISHLQADIEGRKVAITPEGGWPGKNAEERKFLESITCAADEPIKAMRGELIQQQDTMAAIEAEIACLETERRSLEWMVRAQLADALMGKRENHTDAAESAFDDASQAAADSEIVQISMDEYQHISSDNVPDDFPF